MGLTVVWTRRDSPQPKPPLPPFAFLPLRYQGGELLSTDPSDYEMKCVWLLIQYAEKLSVGYGQLLDELPAARKLSNFRNRERKLLF